jgi:hypothetical protein
MTKVAIVMFGLPRSLHRVIDSMRTHIFNKITDQAMEYDVFVHRYNIHGTYTNLWSGESTDNYKNEDVKGLLNPKYYLEDNQEEIAKTICLEDYFTVPQTWAGHLPNFPDHVKCTMKNMILALYSKKQIIRVLEKYKNEYEYVIFLRPDTFVEHFPLHFDRLNNSNMIIPEQDFHYGFNDRVCICKMAVALYYGSFGDYLLEYSKTNDVASEKFALEMLQNKQIGILKDDIRYQNIRYVPPK